MPLVGTGGRSHAVPVAHRRVRNVEVRIFSGRQRNAAADAAGVAQAGRVVRVVLEAQVGGLAKAEALAAEVEEDNSDNCYDDFSEQ